MKKGLLAGLAVGVMMFGAVSMAHATVMISNASLTSNSVTFTINGDMTGYAPPAQLIGFSMEYTGNIFLPDNNYAPNSWSSSIFDNETFTYMGNTGTWGGLNYTWAHFDSTLADAVATNRTVTVTAAHDYFNLAGTGQITFNWGHPLGNHTQIAQVDIVRGVGPENNSVPEPATMLLMGTGLAGLAGFSLRRKKN